MGIAIVLLFLLVLLMLDALAQKVAKPSKLRLQQLGEHKFVSVENTINAETAGVEAMVENSQIIEAAAKTIRQPISQSTFDPVGPYSPTQPYS